MRSKTAKRIIEETSEETVDKVRLWADFKVAKITTVVKIDRQIIVLLDSNEGFTLAPFGKDVYTTVSDNIDKSWLEDFKKDALECGFDEKLLKNKWIKN